MQLTTILLIIVAVLMILSGFLALVGSIKQERVHFVWFFVAMIGGALWTITSGMQIWNAGGDETVSSWLSYGICLGSLAAGLGLLGYYLPLNKKVLRRTLLTIAVIACMAIMVVPFFQFDLLAGVLKGDQNWFYLTYGVLLSVIFLMTAISAVVRICRMQSRKDRKGAIILFVGMLTTLTISVIFNMIFPFMLRTNDFLWVGPLSIYILVLTFYLNLFSTHRITLSAAWFRVLSYVIIIASCAVVYMILFFIIFTSLFHVASPSASVIFLNLIMVTIVLLLMPVLSEVSAYIKSLITIDRIDVGYVIRKLERINPRDVSLQELADFLANHLHCSYVGFVVNKRLYESESSQFDTDTLKAVGALKPAQHGVWQDLDNPAGKVLTRQKVVAVAELCDNKGVVFGQMLIGKPMRKHAFERRDLVQLEVVVNLIAITIASAKKLRK